MPRDRDHARVVRAVLEIRHVGRPAAFLAHRLELAAEVAVGGDAARDGEVLHAVVEGRLLEFLQQIRHDPALVRGADVRLVLRDEVRFLGDLVAEEVDQRGLEARKAEVVARNGRGREGVALGVARPGQLVDQRTAGIAQAHDLGRLVKGLARRVVDALADHLHVEVAARQHDLRVPARDRQAQERKARRRRREEVRQDVRLHVVDVDERDAEAERKTLGKTGPDQQGAQQARPACEGHGLQRPLIDLRLRERGRDHAQDLLLVQARGQFRHDAAVLGVLQL